MQIQSTLARSKLHERPPVSRMSQVKQRRVSVPQQCRTSEEEQAILAPFSAFLTVLRFVCQQAVVARRGCRGMALFQSFCVPLSSREVSEDEVIRDVVAQLQALDKTVDRVFSNITARVTSEKKRIEDVNGRTETCRRLIASLQGSTKGTTVSPQW